MMRQLTTTLIALILTVSAFAGGGWTNGKGKGYAKFGQSFLVSGRYFTPNGDVVDITTTAYYATSLYGEYGLTDRLDVIVYVPFIARATLNELEDQNGNTVTEGDAVTSFGDTDLTLKYGILKGGPLVLAAGVTLGLPLGNPSGGKTKSLQTGDGEFNQLVTLDASRSFGRFYASVHGGYNNRTKGFSDEWRYGAEMGLSLDKWYLIARMYGIKPLNNGTDDFDPQITGIFSNRIEYLSITPEVIYQLNDKIGLSAAVGTAVYGKRILASPNIMIGLFTKF